MTETEATTLEEVLRWEVEQRKRLSASKGRHYVSMGDLVLREGRRMEFGRKELFGPERHCFENSLNYALANFATYCEGYVLGPGGFPIHHAWALDADGKVIETTLRAVCWIDDTAERVEAVPDYFGIAFDMLWLAGHITRVGGHFTILDDWRQDYAMLDEPFPPEAKA
jgi:hypothetical protein